MAHTKFKELRDELPEDVRRRLDEEKQRSIDEHANREDADARGPLNISDQDPGDRR
jgi:hypothetical protein